MRNSQWYRWLTGIGKNWGYFPIADDPLAGNHRLRGAVTSISPSMLLADAEIEHQIVCCDVFDLQQ
jgi:hypothetical protein